MKRRQTAFLLAILLLLLCACGGKGAAPASPSAASAAPASPPAASAAAPAPASDAPASEGTRSAEAAPAEQSESPASDEGGADDYWEELREQWKNEPNEGYVWTITVDEATVLDALGLAETTYDLELSCSHVGKEMAGVYSGSLAMKFDADLSGLNAMMAVLGGSASTDHVDGWFRNDEFVMELKPYNKEKEQAFIGSLDYLIDENGDIVPKQESDPYTEAIVGPLLEQMGSGTKPFETEKTPACYWFDWNYNMTEGDMSQSYAVTGIMGIASASGGMDASGTHISGHAIAHSPLGGTFTDRYDETFDAPFPYIIRVYETGEVVFELHSSSGGPVVIKFYGTIDQIPVSQTTVIR